MDWNHVYQTQHYTQESQHMNTRENERMDVIFQPKSFEGEKRTRWISFDFCCTGNMRMRAAYEKYSKIRQAI